MPNHVHSVLKFPNKETFYNAREVLVNEEGFVDFNILIPMPAYIYQGNLSGQDDQDFKEFTWSVWARNFWNTKWNAYNSEVSKENRSISFDTAWDIPRPIIVAVANTVVAFTHYYLCELTEWWGQERWQGGARLSMSRDNPEHFEKIFIMSHGQETWDEQAVLWAQEYEEPWPPEHVTNSKPQEHTSLSLVGE